jgi:hypothetical protein
MKKIKYLLIIIAVVMLGNISLADNPVELRIPDVTATVGDFINIPIYVDNSVTGENIYSYQFKIYHNAARLSFVSIETAATMSQTWGTPASNVSGTNYLYIAGAGSTPLTGTGVLFYMRFQCISTGGSSLNFDGAATNNLFNEGNPEIIFDDGYISITALPSINVSPDNGLLTVGDNMQFNVSGGTAPYSWFVTNPAIASINSSGLLSSSSHGFTKVVAQDDNGIRDTITGWIEIRAMQLSIHDTTEWQGATIDIPIYTTSLTGLGIMSGNISFTYNQNILAPTALITTGTLIDGYTVSFNNSIMGSVNIAFAGTTPLSGSGQLCYVRFDVSSVNTGGSPLNFTEAIFNEDLPATTDNGYFSTINFSTITVSPNTYTLVAGETHLFSASGGIAPYTWTSSDNTVATIDASGLLTAHHSGVIQVTATDNVGATGSSGNITVYDTYLDIDDASAMVNSVYDLEVNISDLPTGQDVYAFDGAITYRTPELVALSIVPGPQTAGWSIFSNVSGNQISFAAAGTSPLTSAGVLFKIRFQLTSELSVGEFAYVNFGNINLNEGVPLPLTSNGGITGAAGLLINLKVFLEGPYNGTNMNTDLRTAGSIPLSQPFNPSLPYYDNGSPKWLYTGSESVGSIPANVVDWVLVQLRDATAPAGASSATIIGTQAAFVLNNGTIVGLDGSSPLNFNTTFSNNLYAVVFHRNHLAVMSNYGLSSGGGTFNYDFTTGINQAYGGANGHKDIGSGVWGMISADGNGNGIIQGTDETLVWKIDLGNSGYRGGDFNLNNITQATDETSYWKLNLGNGGQVPAKSISGYQSQVPE